VLFGLDIAPASTTHKPIMAQAIVNKTEKYLNKLQGHYVFRSRDSSTTSHNMTMKTFEVGHGITNCHIIVK
jgi:hypothetical protein